MSKDEYHEIVERQYLNYSRVDYRRVKLVSFANIDNYHTYTHDETIDPRIVYIADKNNHCIRRIIIK